MELLFRELKTTCELDEINSGKPEVVEALILIGLLSLVVSRTLREPTSNYYHIRDTLSEYLDVTVANPGKLKLIANSDKKTDRVDAKELARMVRLGSVPESYVPTEEVRECRALVCGRKKLVESRTEYANKIHGLLADHGITRKVKPLSVSGREFLEQ